MKVAISFGNAADIVANAQGRPRFSFGNAVGKKAQCSAAMRSRDKRDVYYDTAFCSALWRLKAFSVLKAARESERSR